MHGDANAPRPCREPVTIKNSTVSKKRGFNGATDDVAIINAWGRERTWTLSWAATWTLSLIVIKKPTGSKNEGLMEPPTMPPSSMPRDVNAHGPYCGPQLGCCRRSPSRCSSPSRSEVPGKPPTMPPSSMLGDMNAPRPYRGPPP
ncbi:uncharacterized protein A4U43_C08F3720 [Asparagus officinalis]|nr:uncharacterized protein A4U43_C08F3720 [Asparagus officinalis]